MFKDTQTGVDIIADLDHSVSHGTLRTYDLTMAFIDVIRNTPEYRQLMINRAIPDYAFDDEDAFFWDSEEAYWLLHELIETCDIYAPEGYYFGCTEGDASDFGYWKESSEDNLPY